MMIRRERDKTVEPDMLTKGAQTLNEKAVGKLLAHETTIRSKSYRGALKRFTKDINLFVAMLKDYWYGRYRGAPLRTILIIAFALFYVLDPFDLLMDPIFVDDAAVVALCIWQTRDELRKYEQWRASQSDDTDG